MYNFIKKLARRILSDELEGSREKYEELEENYYSLLTEKNNLSDKYYREVKSNRIFITNSMLRSILEILPPCSSFCRGDINVEELVGKQNHFNFPSFKSSGFVEFVPNENGEKDGVTVAIRPYNITIFIPIVKSKIDYNIMGINTEVSAFSWDLYEAGIRLISETDFMQIINFMESQYSILKM